MRAYGICPWCEKRIHLRKRKDFESYSKEEVLAHLRVDHPDKWAAWNKSSIYTSIPYTPIEFDG